MQCLPKLLAKRHHFRRKHHWRIQHHLSKANIIEKRPAYASLFSGGDGGDRGASPSHLLRKFPRFYVPRAPPRRTARDGRWVRSPFYLIKTIESGKSHSLLFGGDGGDRTHDLLTASQTLSQLSYAPVCISLCFAKIVYEYITHCIISQQKFMFPFSVLGE